MKIILRPQLEFMKTFSVKKQQQILREDPVIRIKYTTASYDLLNTLLQEKHVSSALIFFIELH